MLIGNSGVGKSSLAQAGVLAALKRQAWPEEGDAPSAWPQVFEDSRRWCFLTLKPGTEPLKALVESFLGYLAAWFGTDPGAGEAAKWLDRALARRQGHAARSARRHRAPPSKELDRVKPPAFLLYIDQGEELYVRAEERQRLKTIFGR